MLAEASTTEISKEKEPQNFEANIEVAKEGGSVANVARKQLEKTTGNRIVTKKNAKLLNELKEKK